MHCDINNTLVPLKKIFEKASIPFEKICDENTSTLKNRTVWIEILNPTSFRHKTVKALIFNAYSTMRSNWGKEATQNYLTTANSNRKDAALLSDCYSKFSTPGATHCGVLSKYK